MRFYKPLILSRALPLEALSTVASSVISNIMTVLGTALIMRVLGANLFGEVVLLTGAASSLSVIPVSGLSLYLIKNNLIAEEERERNELVQSIIGLSIIGSIVLGAIVIFLGFVYSKVALLHLVAVGLVLSFYTLDGIYKSLLISRQHFHYLAIVTVSGAVLSLICQLVGAYTFGSDGFLAGATIGTAIQCQISRYAGQSSAASGDFRLSPLLSGMKDIISRRFIWLATLAASVVPISHWLAANIAVSKSDRYVDAAVLAIGMQFFNVILFLPTVLNKIILPKDILSYSALGDGGEIIRRMMKQVLLYVVIMPIAPLIFWLASPWIIGIYKFDSNQMNVIYVCALASTFSAIAIPISNYLVSQSLMGISLIGNLMWALSYLCGSYFFDGGAVAVSWALLSSYVLNFFIQLAIVFFSGGRRDSKNHL